jgi:two-component system phosphate regulon response regulator OmpR
MMPASRRRGAPPSAAKTVSDQSPHLLVIDDDARLRELLKRFLQKAGYRVSTAVDAADAKARLDGLKFDLLVVDVMMPGQSGIDFVTQIRRSNQVPVLMLTAMGETADRIKGLESGADDYLSKPFEPKELLLRVNAILRRVSQDALAPDIVRFGPFEFDARKGELLRDSAPVALTGTEMALLRVLALNPGATVSRQELSSGAGAIEGRAVDVQITRLRRKIEADSKSPRYLQTVWGEGYVLWTD